MKADYEGSFFQLGARFGLRLKFNKLAVNPSVSIQRTRYSRDEYSEGALGSDLTFKEYSDEFFKVRAQLAFPLPFEKFAAKVSCLGQVRFGFDYNSNNEAYKEQEISALGNEISVPVGDSEGRMNVFGGFTLSASLSERWEAFVSAEVRKVDHGTIYSGSLGFELGF